MKIYKGFISRWRLTSGSLTQFFKTINFAMLNWFLLFSDVDSVNLLLL